MKIARILLLAGLAALSGCDSEGTVRPPPTSVRFFHAAPNFDTLAFLRERNPENVAGFGGGALLRFDSGPYDFGLESSLPGTTTPVREFTYSANVSSAEQYTFVAVAPADQPQLMVFSVPNFAPGSANARYTVVNAHPDLGTVDLYVVPAGTALAGVIAQGSISFGPAPATFEVVPQVLRLYLTPAGDPGTILFESTDFTATAGADNVLVVHATNGQIPANLAVTSVGSPTLRLNQIGMDAQLRVIQAVDDRLSRDVILDDGTAMPLFANQAYGELSGYVAISATEHKLTLTPVGVPGTEERVVTFTPLPGRSYTAIFSGNTTTGIAALVAVEDARPIARQASLFVLNAAGLFDAVVAYIVPPGTDTTTRFPDLFSDAPDFSARQDFAPGDYEITLKDGVTLAVLAGPVPVTLAEKGVYGLELVNAADNVTIELDYFYDLAP